jgi:DNA-binding GntR family transcriptional regulator
MPAPRAPALLDVAQPRVTAHEFVLNTLRRSILGGVMPGGTRLVQADIAEQLSVSTTPVREALRDLAAEGLVVFRPHIGAVVRELNLEELAELYEIRKVLEPLGIRRAAARITNGELTAIAALAREMEAETDPAAWAELNRRFHASLEEAADAPFIRSVLKGIQDIAAIYVAHSLILEPSRIASGNKEHRALLAALRRHDADVAATLLVAHLDATLKSILKVRSESAGPAESAGAARSASKADGSRAGRQRRQPTARAKLAPQA